jgi:hypothetical protein
VTRIFKLRTGGRTLYVETELRPVQTKIGQIVTGRQLDREGGLIVNTLVVMMLEDVQAASEYEMDLHYGQLVPLGTAKLPLKGRE